MAGLILGLGRQAELAVERVALVVKANDLDHLLARPIEFGERADSLPDSFEKREHGREALARNWTSLAARVDADLATIATGEPRSVPLYILADGGDLVASGALAELLSRLDELERKNRPLAISVVLLAPPQQAGHWAQASAYATFAELVAGGACHPATPAPGIEGATSKTRAAPPRRIWLIASNSEIAAPFRVSQWLLATLQCPPSPEINESTVKFGTFGVWAAWGAPQRARALVDLLNERLTAAAQGEGLRRWSAKRALVPFYFDAANAIGSERFAEAERKRTALRLSLEGNNGLGQSTFWRKVDQAKAALGQPNSKTARMPGRGHSVSSVDDPDLTRLSILLDSVMARRKDLADEFSVSLQRVEELRSYELKGLYRGSRAMIRAGRGAAADLLVDAVMGQYDNEVYEAIEGRLRSLLSLDSARTEGERLIAALHGPCLSVPGQWVFSERETASELVKAMESADLSDQPAELTPDDWARGLAFARSECVAMTESTAAERRIIFAAESDKDHMTAEAARVGADLRLRRRGRDVDLVVEWTGISGEAVGCLAKQRNALFERLKAHPESTPFAYGPPKALASTAVIQFTGQEKIRRADALRVFARALALQVARELPDGHISLFDGPIDQPRLLSVRSAILAFDLLCEDEILLTRLRKEVDDVRKRRETDLEVKLAILLGLMAEGLFDSVDVSLGSPLAHEEHDASDRAREAYSTLKRSPDGWSQLSPSHLMRIIRGAP